MMEALALVVTLAVSMLLLEARILGLLLPEEEMVGVLDREEPQMTGVLHQQRQQLGEEAETAGRLSNVIHALANGALLPLS